MGKGVSDAGTGKTPLDAAALASPQGRVRGGRGANEADAEGAQRGGRHGARRRDVTESLAAMRLEARRPRDLLACDASDGGTVSGGGAGARPKLASKRSRRIVHAAGVLRDKMVENKTVDDFDSVFGVKITGLTNILTALLGVGASSLRHLVVFSSLAGFHGNAGQTDYAMANDALLEDDALVRLALGTARRARECFGPWDGGMVTPALKAHFQSQGVEIIPRPEGAEQVAAVLTMQGKERNQCLFGNWGLPGVTPVDAELSVSKATRRADAGVLESHLIQGKAVVPMTVATAMMASAVVKAHPGFFLDSVKDAKLDGLTLTADVETVTKMKRDGAADAAGKLTYKVQILTKSAGKLKPAYAR